MNISDLKFHQHVLTPNGPGIIQGVTNDGKVMVSHKPSDLPVEQRPPIVGIWVLNYYTPDQLSIHTIGASSHENKGRS